MLKFEEAELKLIKFAVEDVITTSGETVPEATKDPDEGEDNEF